LEWFGIITDIHIEPQRTEQDFNETMVEYYQTIAKGEAAAFFAVFRGKVSEGIDFRFVSSVFDTQISSGTIMLVLL
jgi:hypothetical protein